MKTQSILTPLVAGLLVMTLAGAQEKHERDDDPPGIHEVNKGIDIANNARAGNLHTVNGSISIGNHSEVNAAKTVNGTVTLGADSRAAALESVNGAIEVGPRSTVTGSITTVNGRLNLSEDATIQGNATNVNSKIHLEKRAHIGGRLSTAMGDITLETGARIDGGILVKKTNDRWSSFSDSGRRVPVITIGPEAEVRGELVFEHPVKLRVHPTAKIGPVKGADVERL